VGLAFAVASAGADAPMSASITAKDFQWDNGNGGTDVTIAPGGTVSFGYPSGGYAHNVTFSPAPTSCSQTAGTDSGSVPPLPAVPTGAAWAGNCTFNTAGTFSYHCQAHPYMAGAIQVGDPPTGTTDPPPTETGGQPPGGGTPTGGELTQPAVKVAHRQRGAIARGSVTTPAGPSAIAVTALVAKSVLASRARLVKVGSLRKRSTDTGKTSFALRVDRAARRALQRRHRLAVTLRIAVRPDAGGTFKKTVAVVLTKKP
jgi:plastocyanin